jgi:exonuclease III
MNNDIKLDRQHNQKGGTNESIVQWNINGLRNNFEQLTNADGRAGPHDSMPTSMYDSISSPKQFTRHGVAILVKEGIKSERLEMKTKLNTVAKSKTKNPIKKRIEG